MKNLFYKNKPALRALVSTVLLSIVLPLLSLSANAQTTEPQSRQLVIKDKTTVEELPRLALVIGNQKYENVTQLKNAAADAADMTVALQSLGFEVISGIDQNLKQMRNSIREFGDKLQKQGGVGLFFYAGHGVQSNSKNYLIPIDADIPRENEIQDSAIEVNLVLRKFESAKNDLNIIILDACRNNPFAKDWSEARDISGEQGLAKINVPKGTIMFYSTLPGKTASDGAGRNGLFTEALLENIKQPDVEFDVLAKKVKKSVAEKSKQEQIPYKEDTNYGDFYFSKTTASQAPASPVVKSNIAEPEVMEKDAATRERDAWEAVADSTDAGDFRLFLNEFPNGKYAVKAKILLEQTFWNSIKASSDKSLIQNYLTEFPNGANAATARIRLRRLEPAKTETAKVETEKVESVKTEPVKTEPEESAPPVKKVSVPKVETPKASPRTVKAKTKSAAELNKLAERKNSFGMDFVHLPAGSFMMGSSEANISESYALGRKDYKETTREDFDREKPQHRVTFADGFWIGRTEVTQAQWTAVMGDNPSNNKGCDDCPVERVSWEGAKKFVEKLNAQNDGFEYRLPSEAEWEYAARAGKTGISNGKIDDVAWYQTNSENKTHPVGTLQPNAFGLYDMQGNVAEWCEDIFVANYEGTPVDGTADTTGGEPDTHVLRGGQFGLRPTDLLLAHREKLRGIKIQAITNGLRVVAVEKQP